MLNFLKDIKFLVGVISTAMIILSAFRFEIIDNTAFDLDYEDYQAEGTEKRAAPFADSFTIERQLLDALSKFDRNVRHLLIKGKDSSKLDFQNILPDFKDALTVASQVVHDLQKLNLNNCYCKESGGGKKKTFDKKKKGSFKDKRTWQFSFRLGSKTYVIGFYWPKLVRLIIGSDDD